MPFRFEQFQPDTGSILELMSAPGRARAQALRQAAAAQAQAEQFRGQNTARMIGTIGEIATDTAKLIQDAPLRQAQAQSVQADAAAKQQELRGQQQQNAIQRMALVKGQNGVATYDRDLLTREFAAAGISDRLPNVLKGLDAADAAAFSLTEAKREALAGLAYGVMESGNTPQAFNFAIQHAVENGVVSKDEVGQILQQVGDDPNRIGAVTKQILMGSPKWATLIAAKDERATDNRRMDVQFQAQQGDRLADNARQDAQMAAMQADRAADNKRSDAMLAVAQQNANTAQARVNPKTGLSAEIPSEYQNAFERAIMSIPATRRAPKVAMANRLFAEGNTEELKQVIVQAAIEGENVDTKNQILGRRATLASLKDTAAILEEMKAKGVPTNILTGTAEDVARKLGTSTNPEYVELANRLQGTLINYRRAATGVQFGEREGAEYARMFPNYKNTLPVNLALIRGLEREMSTYDHAYWTHKLGPDGAKLVGAPGRSAQLDTTGPKEGDTKPIEGYPGTEQTYKGGKWIRTK